jgi:hypothetical protein
MAINRQIKFIAAGVIGFAIVLAVLSLWSDSIIVDEVPHVGAGYSYLSQKDMRLNPEHPPLAKDIAAIPLLFTNLNQSAFSQKSWLNDINGQWNFGRYFIFNSGNDADLIRHLTKLSMLLFFILAAVLVFIWTRKLYGDYSAIFALLIFCFSPTVMAHARLVTTDVPALFGTLAAFYFFTQYLKIPGWKTFLFGVIAIGVALLTKFSTFLVLPVLLFLAVMRGFVIARQSLSDRIKGMFLWGVKAVLMFTAAVVFVVWPVYLFHTANYPVERQLSDTTYLLGTYGRRFFADPVIWLADKPILRGLGEYLLGLLMVVQRSVGGNTTYFLGEVSNTGWRLYFPIVYFLKETLAWWVLATVAFVFWITGRNRRVDSIAQDGAKDNKIWFGSHFEELAMILWLAIYWFTSVKSSLNIGVRHLLPTIPFAIILVSGQIGKLFHWALVKSEKSISAVMIIPALISLLLGWHLYENIKTFPFYISYFNQTALLRPSWIPEGQAGSAPGGHWYVVDSNLDWGQDLVRFSKWVEENKIGKIEFDYFGWADPSYYLKDKYIWTNSEKYLDAQDFISRNQSNGWLAVSATFLMGSEDAPQYYKEKNYRNWLWEQIPVTTIGNSIFIYNIK